MIKLALIASVIGGVILSDAEERANLGVWIAHWAHRIVFEAIPLTIIVIAFFTPWVMILIAIKQDAPAGVCAATIAIAVLADIAIGKTMIVFNM